MAASKERAEVVEENNSNGPSGCNGPADEMGMAPQMAIFRRFGALNVKNLLFIQAEIIELENDLRRYERPDALSASPPVNRASRGWSSLKYADRNADGDQYITMVTLRAALNRYNKALAYQYMICDMPPPDRHDLSRLQDMFNEEENRLEGPDRHVYGQPAARNSRAPDLVALRARIDEGPFSKWVNRSFARWYFRIMPHRRQRSLPVTGIVGYKDKVWFRVTLFISTLVASLLPIVSITVLYYIQDLGVRLGVIGAFNVIFTFCLMLFTSATRIEIFAATAAFAAVQVVFVSSNST